MIVVTELKKNSQKVVMFNLFHVQVYSGKKLCEYILVKVDKISVLFLRSGKGKVLGHLLQVCSSTSEKKNYGLQIQVFSVELQIAIDAQEGYLLRIFIV